MSDVVVPEPKKSRGRPPKHGKAMSNLERQKRRQLLLNSVFDGVISILSDEKYESDINMKNIMKFIPHELKDEFKNRVNNNINKNSPIILNIVDEITPKIKNSDADQATEKPKPVEYNALEEPIVCRGFSNFMNNENKEKPKRPPVFKRVPSHLK